MPRAAFKRPLARADAEDTEDTADDDGAPRQIRHGIGQWPTRASAPPTASSSVFAAGQAAKPKRAAPVQFDPDAVQIERGVPIPPPRDKMVGRYKRLLARCAPGDCVNLPAAVARGVVMQARKMGRKVPIRGSEDGATARVWILN